MALGYFCGSPVLPQVPWSTLGVVLGYFWVALAQFVHQTPLSTKPSSVLIPMHCSPCNAHRPPHVHRSQYTTHHLSNISQHSTQYSFTTALITLPSLLIYHSPLYTHHVMFARGRDILIFILIVNIIDVSENSMVEGLECWSFSS